MKRVSIPYRLATNQGCSGVRALEYTVSIPYRLATNSYKEQEEDLTNQFQFLIGWLQTGGPRNTTLLLLVLFQFLIGWLQTVNIVCRCCPLLCFNSLQVGYKLHIKASATKYGSRFNSLQVGYKRTQKGFSDRRCIHVSIPYRLATNVIAPTCVAVTLWFQFLIGWLQTAYTPYLETLLREFQFLIGWLQTLLYRF